MIAPFGGQSAAIPPEQGAVWRFEYLDADTPAEVTKAVRQNIYYGAGVIKLVADNSAYTMSTAEIEAALKEAHRAGVPVAVHVYGGKAAQAAIDAGVDSIEHGHDLTDVQLRLMKKKGIFLVGTDFPLSYMRAVGTSGGVFPEDPAPFSRKIVDRLRRAHRIGVKMAFGTDIFIDVPNRTRADLAFDYLGVWREAGVEPGDILRCMTSNAAELLRINANRGSLAVGYKADVVAMPASPLENIESLRQIDFVMKDGRIIRQP
jgi:imidazolonepropionase-like amidohydrolase